MPSLMLILENCERHVYPLNQSPILIGRDPSVHVQLPSEKVSLQHASITPQGADYVFQNLSPESGSFVNGQRVETTILKDRDILRIGEYLFLFTSNGTQNPKAGVPVRQAAKATPAVQAGPPRPGASVPAANPPSSLSKQELPSYAKKSVQPWFKSAGLIIFFPLLLLFVFFFTGIYILKALPLDAREAMIASEKFQNFSFFSVFRLFVRPNEDDVSTANVVLQKDNPTGTDSLHIYKPTRFIVKLKFVQKTTVPIRLKSHIAPKQKDALPLFQQTLDVPVGSESFTLLTYPLQEGDYQFQCTFIDGPPTLEVPVSILIFREYE